MYSLSLRSLFRLSLRKYQLLIWGLQTNNWMMRFSFFFNAVGLSLVIASSVDSSVAAPRGSVAAVVEGVGDNITSIIREDVVLKEAVVLGGNVAGDVVGSGVVVITTASPSVNDSVAVALIVIGDDCVDDVVVVLPTVVGGNVVDDVVLPVVDEAVDEVVDDMVSSVIDDAADDAIDDVVFLVVDDAAGEVVDVKGNGMVDGFVGMVASVRVVLSSPIVHLSKMLKSKSITLLRFP